MIQNSKMNFRRMHLRPVGKQTIINQKCKKNMKISSKIQRGEDISNEEIQLLSQADYLKDQQPENQDIQIFNLIEDPRESEFTYRKCVLLEKILLILTVFYILMCIIRTQILQNLNQDVAKVQDKKLIIIMNIISLGIIVILLRNVCHNELKIDQKAIYCVRHKTGIISDIGRFFQKKRRIIYFLAEVIFILVHPNIFFQEIKVKMFQPYDQVILSQDLNDILCLMSLFRIYLIIRPLISMTQYSTPRAARLCSYNKIQHDFIYSVKCLLKEHPLLTIFTSFLIQQLALGYGMRISEGNVQKENPNFPSTGFQNYINCFWCVFITMATVGYGDYFPKTVGGRAVSFFAAISGIIVNSLLIVSLSAYLTMQTSETSSHLTLIRLQHQQKLKQEATDALIETMRLEEYLSNRNDKNKINNIFTTLKSKIDMVKYRSRKIKSLVNNNNIMEEMNRLFQIQRQNLIELYKAQLLLKQDLLSYGSKKPTKRYLKEMQTLMLTDEFIKV